MEKGPAVVAGDSAQRAGRCLPATVGFRLGHRSARKQYVLLGSDHEPVVDDVDVALGDLVDREGAVRPPPTHGGGDAVTNEPAHERRVELASQDTVANSSVDDLDPYVLELFLGVLDMGEPVDDVAGVLDEPDRLGIGGDTAEGRPDQLGQRLSRVEIALGNRPALAGHAVVVLRQDDSGDVFLGVEVVVEAAGKDAGLVGDAANGRGGEALPGEEVPGDLDQLFSPQRHDHTNLSLVSPPPRTTSG